MYSVDCGVWSISCDRIPRGSTSSQKCRNYSAVILSSGCEPILIPMDLKCTPNISVV